MIKVNDEYGIYIVKELLNDRDKYHHRLYKIQCKICRKEFIRVANRFAAPSTITTVCQHLSHEERDAINLNQWISEKHTCEICGKVMTEKFGSGRFCSEYCAHVRELSEDSKNKIALKIRGTAAYTNIDTLEVKYFKDETNVPYNYIKGNINNCKSKEIIDGHLVIQHKSSHLQTREKHISISKLLENNQSYIEEHNNKVITEYNNLLATKANGKTFEVDNQFMFAKYYSVTMQHDRGHDGHVFVHILLAEKLLDRPLDAYEIVHHKNQNKLDNTFNNIWIFNNKASHARYHNAKYFWLKINNDVLICEPINIEELPSR